MKRASLENRELMDLGGRDAVFQEVADLKGDRLSALWFNLPSVGGGGPELVLYGGSDLAGYIFKDSGMYFEETSFGIETEEDESLLESSDLPQYEVDPFMDREVHPFTGFRRYEVPLYSGKEFRVDVEVNDHGSREEDQVALYVLDGGETVSKLLAGRSEDGWSYLQRAID